MAITDVISTIKDYFLNWHNENYNTLHSPITNQVTNQSPYKDQAVTSKAVYDYANNKFNNITTCNVKMCNNTETSLQTTLDDFNNNKLNKNQYASADINYWWSNYTGSTVNCKNTQDGVMKWQEKILLQELATWHVIKTNLPPKCSMEVNFALGLCHLHLYAKGSSKLKNSTTWEYESDGRDALLQFAPPAHVQVPASPEGSILRITPAGGFVLKSPKKYTSTSIVADVIWRYENGATEADNGSNWGTNKKTMYNGIYEI